jgi:hypothetical protein
MSILQHKSFRPHGDTQGCFCPIASSPIGLFPLGSEDDPANRDFQMSLREAKAQLVAARRLISEEGALLLKVALKEEVQVVRNVVSKRPSIKSEPGPRIDERKRKLYEMGPKGNDVAQSCRVGQARSQTIIPIPRGIGLANPWSGQ